MQYKEILEVKFQYKRIKFVMKKILRIKFVGMGVTLKPSLVFNWVMFLGGFSVLLTVISNGKFKQ